jgi:hypothetical protein
MLTRSQSFLFLVSCPPALADPRWVHVGSSQALAAPAGTVIPALATASPPVSSACRAAVADAGRPRRRAAVLVALFGTRADPVNGRAGIPSLAEPVCTSDAASDSVERDLPADCSARRSGSVRSGSRGVRGPPECSGGPSEFVSLLRKTSTQLAAHCDSALSATTVHWALYHRLHPGHRS